MNRLRSLDPAHKGLRNALGQLVLLAGKTDFSNKAAVQKLQALGTEVVHLLKDHTATENQFILAPLAQKNADFTAAYLVEHTIIDRQEQELADRLQRFDGSQSNDMGHEFYLDLCDFQSSYLKHIDEEDRLVEAEMQKHFTDEELIGHQIEIMQVMPFDTLLLWFKYIVPARRDAENAQVLTAFKQNAPAEAYETVIALIATQVKADELEIILKLVQ
ncbi:MAG: hypothetical protein RL699_1166 [Bacteroidota bacterium]|jgi:hypothetical protein